MIAEANSIMIPLADKSVHCCVTSPPYWGLRDYGLPPTEWPTVTYTPMAGLAPVTVQGCEPGCAHEWVNASYQRRSNDGGKTDKQLSNAGSNNRDIPVQADFCAKCGGWRGSLGLEPTPEMFVGHIIAVLREVWRVLRDDGTCWVNFGDSYASQGGPNTSTKNTGQQSVLEAGASVLASQSAPVGLKPKDLCGIPWRVAFALQADGWYMRNDIIWHKPNPMPESVTDRCTKSHEYLFLLSKSQRYFYDNEAVKETSVYPGDTRHLRKDTRKQIDRMCIDGGSRARTGNPTRPTRNRRTVWTIPTRGYSGAHFATFPPALVAPCVLAGTSARGVCPVCGAPRERMVEKQPASHIGATGSAYPDGGNANRIALARQAARAAGGEYVNNVVTTGWRPTCEHDADPVPATVLDPFCGSGTVGEVCRTHSRKFVGFDLSSTYLRDLALPRAENKCTGGAIASLPLFGGA